MGTRSPSVCGRGALPTLKLTVPRRHVCSLRRPRGVLIGVFHFSKTEPRKGVISMKTNRRADGSRKPGRSESPRRPPADGNRGENGQSRTRVPPSGCGPGSPSRKPEMQTPHASSGWCKRSHSGLSGRPASRERAGPAKSCSINKHSTFGLKRIYITRSK